MKDSPYAQQCEPYKTGRIRNWTPDRPGFREDVDRDREMADVPEWLRERYDRPLGVRKQRSDDGPPIDDTPLPFLVRYLEERDRSSAS